MARLTLRATATPPSKMLPIRSHCSLMSKSPPAWPSCAIETETSIRDDSLRGISTGDAIRVINVATARNKADVFSQMSACGGRLKFKERVWTGEDNTGSGRMPSVALYHITAYGGVGCRPHGVSGARANRVLERWEIIVIFLRRLSHQEACSTLA